MSIPQVGGYGYELPYQYYQNQLWQNPYMMNYGLYGMNMPTFCANPTADTYKPKVSQVSANQEIKQNDNTKKSGMSKGAKWALGIAGTAATVYGGVVLHKHINKPTIEKITKNFSEIFRRDVSKDEAQKMVGRYKEIFEIKDKDEFIQKAFAQVKKDFGYEELEVQIAKLPKERIAEAKKMGRVADGGYLPLNPIVKELDNGEFIIKGFNSGIIYINPERSKQSLFNTIIHEITHIKQHEIAYRTDKNAFFEALRKARIPDLGESTYKAYCQGIEANYPTFNKLPKITKGSKEHELGLKYINELSVYKSSSQCKNYDDYAVAQILEKEAHATKPLADEIYNHFASIWRLG